MSLGSVIFWSGFTVYALGALAWLVLSWRNCWSHRGHYAWWKLTLFAFVAPLVSAMWPVFWFLDNGEEDRWTT